jgi:hypothetical protein
MVSAASSLSGSRNAPLFYKQLPEDKKKQAANDGADDERAPFLLCHYTIFNVEQCDGLTLPEVDQPWTAPEVDEDDPPGGTPGQTSIASGRDYRLDQAFPATDEDVAMLSKGRLGT